MVLLALEPRIAGTVGKEVSERPILIPQTLRQAGRGHLGEPLVPGRALPHRQPAREIDSAQSQPALAVGFRADPEGGVPQPPSGAEPPIQQPALSPVGIGANPVAACDRSHYSKSLPHRSRAAAQTSLIRRRTPGTSRLESKRRANGSSRRGRSRPWALQPQRSTISRSFASTVSPGRASTSAIS